MSDDMGDAGIESAVAGNLDPRTNNNNSATNASEGYYDESGCEYAWEDYYERVFQPIEGIGAQTLMESVFEQPTWVVEGFLSTSMTCVLAAPPKTGKSFFALQLAHCVATGQSFLGWQTVKSPVLYLALEDVNFRLQSRLWGMTDESSDSLVIATAAHGLHDDLIVQLEEHLHRNPETKLIIVDTLQVVRGGDADCKYASDYDDMRKLKSFADHYGICCIAVTHLRKLESPSDPFAEITGTTGISGAVDQMLVMKKADRRSSECDLYVTGRDVPDAKLKLRRDGFLWELVEKVEGEEYESEAIPDCVKAAVEFAEKRDGAWMGTASQLLEILGSVDVTAPMLGKFLAQHRAWMAEHGVDYAMKRTASARTISLTPLAMDDGADGNDGECAIA